MLKPQRLAPRGSTSGLIKLRESQRLRNSTRLNLALRKLIDENSNEKITAIRLCKLVGLKSTSALKEKWNSDIKQMLEQHNANLTTKHSKESAPKLPARELARTINRQIDTQQILKEICLLKAENSHMAQQIATLKEINARLFRFKNRN